MVLTKTGDELFLPITYNVRPKHATQGLYQAFVAINGEQIEFPANRDSFHVDLDEEGGWLLTV